MYGMRCASKFVYFCSKVWYPVSALKHIIHIIDRGWDPCLVTHSFRVSWPPWHVGNKPVNPTHFLRTLSLSLGLFESENTNIRCSFAGMSLFMKSAEIWKKSGRKSEGENSWKKSVASSLAGRYENRVSLGQRLVCIVLISRLLKIVKTKVSKLLLSVEIMG